MGSSHSAFGNMVMKQWMKFTVGHSERFLICLEGLERRMLVTIPSNLKKSDLVGGFKHFLMFHNIWDNPRGRSTTNQFCSGSWNNRICWNSTGFEITHLASHSLPLKTAVIA